MDKGGKEMKKFRITIGHRFWEFLFIVRAGRRAYAKHDAPDVAFDTKRAMLLDNSLKDKDLQEIKIAYLRCKECDTAYVVDDTIKARSGGVYVRQNCKCDNPMQDNRLGLS